MGILNVTPDSFSDGGQYNAVDAGRDRALEMIAEGAHIIDIGGESTRPGASPVSAAEEIDRVAPVIEAIRNASDTPISIDTSKADVMRAAVAAGADLINDVRALREEGALEAAAELAVPVCLMHMQGQPRTMQQNPEYSDVVADVLAFLEERAAVCVAAGIPADRIVLDQGYGFGKTLEHNVALFRAIPQFAATGRPLLVGVSRKSMIGALLGDDSHERVTGSVTLAVAAARKGAHILRVHDVQQTVAALTIAKAVQD